MKCMWNMEQKVESSQVGKILEQLRKDDTRDAKPTYRNLVRLELFISHQVDELNPFSSNRHNL